MSHRTETMERNEMWDRQATGVLGRGMCLTVAMSLGACEDATSPSNPTDIEYIAQRFEVVVDTPPWSPIPIGSVLIEIGVVNRTKHPVGIQWGGCPIWVVAYEPREVDPIWDQFRTSRGCNLALNGARISAGDTLVAFRTRVWLADMLADSLPVGSYRFEAWLDGGGPLDLGIIELPVSRYPVWSSPVVHNGFSYDVALEPEPAPGGDVTVRLTISNTVNQTLERFLTDTCAVRLLAFEDSIAQTTIPQPEPSWVWPQACGPGNTAVRLGEGESTALEEVLSRQGLLDTGVPAGAYAVTGHINVDGRLIRIDAGSLQVGP